MEPDQHADQVEIPLNTWEAAVFTRYKNVCSGCGGATRLAPRLVVEEARGGKRTIANSTLLCVLCDVARTGSAPGAGTRALDLQVSRKVSDLIHTWPGRGVFSGMSGGLRQLMEMYVAAPGRFPDLAFYQDGDAEAQINFRVSLKLYEDFRDLAQDHGLSVRAALVGLVMAYEEARGG
jgi:hypothetical protein